MQKSVEWKKCGHIPSKDELKHVSDCVIRLARDLNKLSFVNNVLVKNVHTDENEIRVIVLPKSCIDIVLHELHDNIGHPGRDRTLSLIKGRFYWPGYTRDVDNYVKHCFRCLCRKSRTAKSPVTPIHYLAPP